MSRKAFGAVTLAVLAAVASTALAAQPRGNFATYQAFDHGREVISLVTQTKTQLNALFCYHGFPWSIDRVVVKPDGSFSYHGRARTISPDRTAPAKITGRFVTKNKAVGHFSGPCAKNRAFTATYRPGR